MSHRGALNSPALTTSRAAVGTGSTLRRFPAALAICSDLDETPDANTYFEILRFLNTTQDTRMGPGVGLEVGNTLYFDMPPGRFSYWNASEMERENIRALIRSGHIDCLHSYGDLATTRKHAGRALEELERHDCRLKVWIDHARAPTNFGSDIMHGHGDQPGHAAYHADLTLSHGVTHVWRGRVTSIIGQSRPCSLRGIFTVRHAWSSSKTVAKEALKHVLAGLGNRKYALHRGNPLFKSCVLRDGNRVKEFIRCHPSWAGVSGHDRGDSTQHVLTQRYLDRLATRGGASIFYTHLGKLNRGISQRSLPSEAVEAFRLLAEYQQAGKILVLTTSRLLEAHAMSANGYIAPAPLTFPNIHAA